jgi:hypothetical protein
MQMRQALAFTGQWLIALVIVWTVALSSVLRTVARWLWPEQALLLGLLGWQLAGPTIIVLFLVALGVCGRLFLLVQGARALRQRWSTPVSGGSVLRA